MLRTDLGMAPAEELKAHIDAVSRDYVCEPFLGEQQGETSTLGYCSGPKPRSHILVHFSVCRLQNRQWRGRAPSHPRESEGERSFDPPFEIFFRFRLR